MAKDIFDELEAAARDNAAVADRAEPIEAGAPLPPSVFLEDEGADQMVELPDGTREPIGKLVTGSLPPGPPADDGDDEYEEPWVVKARERFEAARAASSDGGDIDADVVLADDDVVVLEQMPEPTNEEMEAANREMERMMALIDDNPWGPPPPIAYQPMAAVWRFRQLGDGKDALVIEFCSPAFPHGFPITLDRDRARKFASQLRKACEGGPLVAPVPPATPEKKITVPPKTLFVPGR